MRIRRALIAVSLPTLALAACTDEADDAEQADPPPADEQADGDPAQPDADDEPDDPEAAREVEPVRVDLLDAGDEPRQQLRLDLEAGTEVTGTLAFEEDEVVAEDAEGQPEGPPQAAEIELRLEVTDVSDGRATIGFVYEQVTVAGQDDAEANPLEGVEGEVVLDERSRLVGTTQSAGGLDQLPIALPEEEVGPGAVWEVRTEEVFGLPATQVMTVELVALEGDEYELELTSTTEGPDEPTPMPGADDDAGGQLQLDELERDGTGAQRASLTTPFPLRSTLATDTLLVVSLADAPAGPSQGPGPETEQRQRLREEVTFERD